MGPRLCLLEGVRVRVKGNLGDFPGGPVAGTLRSQCKGPGSIPGQGARAHMLQLRPRTAKKKKKKRGNLDFWVELLR